MGRGVTESVINLDFFDLQRFRVSQHTVSWFLVTIWVSNQIRHVTPFLSLSSLECGRGWVGSWRRSTKGGLFRGRCCYFRQSYWSNSSPLKVFSDAVGNLPRIKSNNKKYSWSLWSTNDPAGSVGGVGKWIFRSRPQKHNEKKSNPHLHTCSRGFNLQGKQCRWTLHPSSYVFLHAQVVFVAGYAFRPQGHQAPWQRWMLPWWPIKQWPISIIGRVERNIVSQDKTTWLLFSMFLLIWECGSEHGLAWTEGAGQCTKKETNCTNLRIHFRKPSEKLTNNKRRRCIEKMTKKNDVINPCFLVFRCGKSAEIGGEDELWQKNFYLRKPWQNKEREYEGFFKNKKTNTWDFWFIHHCPADSKKDARTSCNSI